MSHNLRGRASAQLETFSGTVTLAQPHDLPEGASPRNQNCDFSVGSVFTRQGLVNPFTYSGGTVGPVTGGTAADTSLNGAAWNNPGNVLLDTGVYATATFPFAEQQSASASLTCTSSKWANPSNATSSSAYATTVLSGNPGYINAAVSGLSIPATATILGIEVSCSSYYSGTTGVVELGCSFELSQESESISQTVAQIVFGSPTYLWNTTFTPESLNSGTSLVIDIAAWNGAVSGDTVYVNNLVFTVYYSIPAYFSDAIDIKQFGLSIPSSETPQGLVVSVDGYATAAATLIVQMLKAGSPVGSAESVALNVGSVTTLDLGGINDLFGNSWTYADLNNTAFGIRLTVVGTVATTVYLGYTTLKIYSTPTQVNFNYITTYEDSFGNIENLALDNDGNWFYEDVTNNPGVLVSLMGGAPAGSFASSFTADSRQFIATSDLLQGNYIPQAYNGSWTDRISQVGPGKAPSFTSTLSTGSVASITAYSAASGILTLTADNTLTAGEIITIVATSSDALYALNGDSFNVLGTGLSTTQFEISTTLVTGSGTSTATATPQYTYPVTSITQYAQQSTQQTGFDGILWSAGPGSTSSGNVITIYYNRTAEDKVLDKAFSDGLFSVYVYVTGTDIAVANGTFLVTSTGKGTPPGASSQRYYFTYGVSSSSYKKIQSGDNSARGRYQMTVATIQTTLPLPGVQTGDDITITGNSVTGWDNTWKIVDALNSGSYSISETSMTSGVATYTWALSGSTTTPPVAGQLVTITGTTGGNGIFNVTDAVISTVTGTSSGTFTVTGFSDATYGTTVESDSQAVTSGTKFQIDPGVLTLGETVSTSPIYGDSTGGYITLVGSSSVVIGTGTRKGTVFFITRNGYWTPPAPPVKFTTTDNTNYILASNIPIGPPDVIARGIAFTEAGQEGQAGGSYYTIPTPVSFVYNRITYLSSQLIINDNTTTTAKFTFPDSVLLNATEIDIQGGDLFSLGELGDSAWCCQYAGRAVFGRVRNKIQNFLNLTFDGGYLPNTGGNLQPLGWGQDVIENTASNESTLNTSPVFGNSYYIQNNTGASAAVLGMIIQSAYQDWNNVAILQNQTAYSVRVTCRTPSSATTGSLVVDLTEYDSGSGYGTTYGTYTLACSSMDSAMTTYSGTLLLSSTLNIPTNLYIRVWAQNLLAGGDIEIDRIEIFPTETPTNYTQLLVSYENDWESFDQTTGGIDTTTVNAQPANGAFIMDAKLYVLKESSLGYTSDTTGQEPSNWNPFRQISNVAGAAGINAWDAITERWAIFGNESGLYIFAAGAPVPIQLEIPGIWSAINWKTGGQSVVIRNDSANRRIFIAAPMTTPNDWCPDFPVNINPTTPNVIIYLNYKGIEGFDELESAAPLHVTMMGKLAVHDLRRKWSLWSIQTPYIGSCKRSELSSEMMFCNGIESSKIYELGSATLGADDGVPFPQSYCTYGFVQHDKVQENPLFGDYSKRFTSWQAVISGSGTAGIIFYQNVLDSQYPFIVPGGVTLSSPAYNDLWGPLDEYAVRLFTEINMQGVGNWFSLSRLTLAGRADPWSPIRGF